MMDISDTSKHIVFPQSIDHETYTLIANAVLTERADDITLHMFCDGGESDSARAIAELIRFHGNVTAIMWGGCMSSAITVFAACQHRYLAKEAHIGLHMVGINYGDRRMVSTELDQISRQLTRSDRAQAELLER